MACNLSGTGTTGPPNTPAWPGLRTSMRHPRIVISRVMARRRANAALWALNDYMLKDIGVSRGEIDRITRL